jgi:acetyltransferase-like isoleucine patch superfamily enzyme
MAVQDYNDPMEYRDRQEYQSLAPTITSPDLSPALGASAINPIIIGEDVSVGTRVVVYRGHRTIIDRYKFYLRTHCGFY